MNGTIYSDKFKPGDLLEYSGTNITDSGECGLAQELATALVDYACKNMDDDLSDAELTAEDLGFLNY